MQTEDKFFARDFPKVLSEIRAGLCEQELSEKLNEVTKACIATGKNGSISLTITIAPQGSTQAIVADNIKAKIPKHSVQPTIMFVDDDANLTRRDPRQMSIVDAISLHESEDTIKVDQDTGEILTVVK